MTTPAVSVVIPTRNYGHYLPFAIESVVGQESVETEIVVVDDGSEDDTAEVVSGYRDVEYIRLPHSGVGAARNAGVRHSTCDWIAFLDADDVWKPYKLIRQLEAVAEDPTRDLIYGQVEEFVSDDAPHSLLETLQVRSEPYAAPIPSVMFLARKTLESLGDFREDRDSGEALDWMLRIRERGLAIHAVDDVLALRRVHATNSGRITRPAQQREYLDAIKRSLVRRRMAEEGNEA